MLIAARDRVRARRSIGSSPAGEVPEGGSVNPAARTALARFYSIAAPFDPAYRIIGTLGRAGSVKARLTH